MNKIKMLAFDIDGTFVNADKIVPQENMDLLRQLKDNHVHLVLSTGRMPQSAIELTKSFDLGVHFTACNGSSAYINDGDENFQVISEIYYDYDVLKELLEYLDDFDLYYHFYAIDKVYTNRPLEVAQKFYKLFIKNFDRDIQICDRLSEAIFPEIKVSKTGLHADGSYDFEHMRRELEKNKKIAVTLSDSTYLDINPAGVNKWCGLEKLMNHFGLSRDELIYFGDQENDLECIKNVGVGVAMKNGTDLVKSNARYVTEYDNDNAGVARCVQDLLERGLISF